MAYGNSNNGTVKGNFGKGAGTSASKATGTGTGGGSGTQLIGFVRELDAERKAKLKTPPALSGSVQEDIVLSKGDYIDVFENTSKKDGTTFYSIKVKKASKKTA